MKCQNCGADVLNHAKFCPKCGTKVEQQPKISIDNSSQNTCDVWPEWKLEKQLGKGSYGVVYHAVRRDNSVESHAAIKIISIPSDSSEVDSLRSEGLGEEGTRTYFRGIVDDFVGEIQLMESLKGIKNIVSVEDYKVVERIDRIGWTIYIRMELLTSFNDFIRDKEITESEVIKLGVDICEALEICGKRNVIHRDIKPENIFVNDFGYFKLGDFGIARKLENVTGGMSQKGTFNYMAPEVANSREYDARVDVYSLGIVLYRLLNNNKLPFLETDKQLLSPNERKLAVERRIRGEALSAPCTASPEMANLILRACAYNPNARFATATEMKEALMSVANGTYSKVNIELDQTTCIDPDATTLLSKDASDNAKFVGMFGDSSGKKQKKSKKGKIIAISILCAVVALVVALTAMFFTGPVYSVYKNVKDQNYSSAASQYRREIKDNFVHKLVFDAIMDDGVNTAVEKYNYGEWDYATAKEYLDSMEKMEFEGASEKLKEITETYANSIVDKFSNGELSYEDAKNELNSLSESGYGNASEKLNSVNEAYSNGIVEKYNKGEIDYNAAKQELTNLKAAGYEDASLKIGEIAKTYAEKTAEGYKNGVLGYSDAIDILNVLKADGYAKSDELITELTANENSNEALNKGNEYYENGDYEEAITELSKIPEGSDNYEKAQKTLNEVYTKYIASVVDTVNKYNASKKYKEAVQYVNIAYDVLPDDVDTTDIDTAKEESLTAYKTEVANEVTALINEEKFVEAFASIDNAISFDDNEYFQSLKTSAQDEYVASVTAIVQSHLDVEDYISAKRVVENALTVLTNNEALTALKTKVESQTPTYLLDVCKPYESNGFAEYINGETISMGGKTYTNGFTMGGDHYSDEYAIFNLDGKYSSLSFLVGHIDGHAMLDAAVKVYCDGVLKNEYVVKNDALPEKITIDITGVRQMKIVVGGLNRNVSYGFANVTVQ